VLASWRKQVRDDDPEKLNAMRNLAGALGGQGKWVEAETLEREALASWRKREGTNGSETASTLHELGDMASAQKKWSEAEMVYREELGLRRTQGGNNSPDTLYALRNLGATLEFEGKWAEAENVHREALASLRNRVGNGDLQTLYTLDKLGWALEMEGKWSEAEGVYREALSSRRNGAGNDNPQALSEVERVTWVLMNEKKFNETEQVLDETLTPAVIAQPSCCTLLFRKADFMGRQGRWQEAAEAASLFVKYQPTEEDHCHSLAALLAITQNRPAYESLCKKILATFTNTSDPYIDERNAIDCLFLPNSGVDLNFVDKLADKSVSLGGGYSIMICRIFRRLKPCRLTG
jgi:tetratricopeptide (TPR) repeat protein